MIEKKYFHYMLLALLLFLTACSAQGAAAPTPTPIPTPVVAQKPTYTVGRGTVAKVLELRGRVSAVKQEDLFFRTNGTVDSVLVGRGDMVSEGQVLAYLGERQSLESALADARLEFLKAQKTLTSIDEDIDLERAEALMALLKAKAELEDAQRARNRMEQPRASATTIAEAEAHYYLMEESLAQARELFAQVEKLPATDPERASALLNLSGVQRARDQSLATLNWYKGHSSSQEIDQANAKVALAEAKLDEAQRKYDRIKDGPDPYDIALAEAQVARAEVNLNKAQANMDSLEITAPFAGQVLTMALTPGLQVTAYKNVLTLVDASNLEITLMPTPTELNDISIGQTAQVRLSNRPGEEYAGVVRYMPLPSSGTSLPGQTIDQSVRVALQDAGVELTLGEIATVIIELEEHENTLWVAPAALRTFQGRDFVIVQDGEVQRRVDVRLGLRSQERVEIIEGLSEGQIVVGP
jgi:HlyD family secretion protein